MFKHFQRLSVIFLINLELEKVLRKIEKKNTNNVGTRFLINILNTGRSSSRTSCLNNPEAEKYNNNKKN